MTEPATSHARELRRRNQERAEYTNHGHIIAAVVRRGQQRPPGPPATLRHQRAYRRARNTPHKTARSSLSFLLRFAGDLSQYETTKYTETARVVRERNQYAATLVYLAGDGYSDPRRSPYYIP